MKKKMSFHQNNAPCHRLTKIMAKLHELCFELLPHRPYSPALAPSDYLFANFSEKICSPEKKHGCNEELNAKNAKRFENEMERVYDS